MPDQYSQVPQYQNVETPVAALDYSFLQTALQTKEKQFGEGAAQIKGLYSSILNAPISNPENIQERDKYVQKANQSMQKLSKADLSLPQNIGEAQKVFAPFWEDQDMVADIYNTKKVQNQLQTLDTWKTSPDEKIREQYSKESVEDVQSGLTRIREAKRGDGSLKNIRTQDATPVRNLTTYLDDEAKKEDLKIVWNDVTRDKNGNPVGSPYMIEGVNGERSLKDFYSWAKSKVGRQYDDQFSMYGRVSKERAIQQNMAIGHTRKDAEILVGEPMYNNYKSVYENNFNKVSSDYIKSNQDLLDLEQLIRNKEKKNLTMTPEEGRAYIELVNRNKSLGNSYTELKRRVSDLNSPDTKEKFIQNSENYLADGIKEQFLTDWATGAASHESKRMVPDQAWNNKEQLAIQERTLEENMRFHNMENGWHQMENSIKLWEFQKKYPAGNSIGTIVGNSGELASYADPAVLSAKHYEGLRNEAYHLLFDPERIGSTLVGKDSPISTEDVRNFNVQMQSLVEGNSPVNTPAIKASMDKIHNYLASKGATTSKAGLEGWADVMNKYVTKFVQENQGPVADLSKLNKANEIRTYYNEVTNNLDLVNKYNQAYTDNIKKLSNTSAYKDSPLITTNSDGTKRIVDERDIKKVLNNGDLRVINPEHGNGELSTISMDDIAKAYKNNTLELDPSSNPLENIKIKIGDKTFLTSGMSDLEKYTFLNNYRGLVKKFGDPELHSKLHHNLVEAALPDYEFWKKHSGEQTPIVEFSYDEKEDPTKTGTKLLAEVGQHTNTLNIYTKPDGGGSSDFGDEHRKSLERLTARDDASEYFTKPRVAGTSQDGNPIIMLHIKHDAKSKNADLEKLSDTPDIYIEMKPNSQTPVWNNIVRNLTGFAYHPELENGGKIQSSNVDNANGFSWNIIGNKLTNPDKAITTLNYNYYNPQTGKNEPRTETEYTPLANTTIDALKGKMNTLYNQYHSGRVNNIKKRAVDNQSGIKFDDLKNSINQP